MDTTEIELASDLAEDIGDLISLKDASLASQRPKVERKQASRTLVNGEAIDTPEGKLANYGISHRAAQNYVTPIEQLVLGTNDLFEVKLDFDQPEQDSRLAKNISNIFNKHIANSGDRLSTLWRQSASEGFVVGGGAFYFDDQHAGVYPKWSNRLHFPSDTPLYPTGVTFAVERLEVTLNGLRDMLKNEKNKGKIIDREKIEKLIEGFEKELGDGNVSVSTNNYSDGTVNTQYEREHPHGDGYGDRGSILNNWNPEGSVREGEQDTVDLTLEMWRWWEVRTHKKGKKAGQRYVSSILFIDDTGQAIQAGDADLGRCILIQDEEAFERAEDWMIFSVQDEEFGGDRTVGTIKGIAEVLYTPSVQAERFADRIMEGAILRSGVLLVPDGSGTHDYDEGRNWDPTLRADLPEGWKLAEIPKLSSDLFVAFELLTGLVAQNSSGDRSNSGQGGELRQQALERQQNSAATKAARILRNYRTLDSLLQMIVAKCLTAEPVIGSEDYCLIKLVQELVDEEIAKDIEVPRDVLKYDEDGEFTPEVLKLAKEYRLKIVERKYGYLVNLTVTAKRNATGIDKASEMEQAGMLLDLLKEGVVPDQLLPVITRYFITLATGNPDWASILDEDTQEVMRSQRLVAMVEQQSIMSRAFSYNRTKEGMPIGLNDIHSDHIESDFNTVLGLIERHESEPLTVAEHVGLNWILVHTSLHIDAMRRMPKNNGKVKQYEQQLAQFSAELAQIAPEAVSGAQQQDNGLPDPEVLAAQKTLAEINKKNAETQEKQALLPYKINDMIGTDEQRKRRAQSGAQKDQFNQQLQVANLQDRRAEKSFDQQVTVEELAQRQVDAQKEEPAKKDESST